MQMGFPGMQGNNGMRGNGMFQGANRQMNNLQGQQGMFRGQQQFMGQNGRQLQGQMNRMPGSFGRFPQGQGGFQQPNRNTGQFNPCLFGLLNPPGFALFVIPLLNPPPEILD
jgi:hypothetical protein